MARFKLKWVLSSSYMGVDDIEKACLVHEWPHLSKLGVLIQSLKWVSHVSAHKRVTFPQRKVKRDYSKIRRMSQRTNHAH